MMKIAAFSLTHAKRDAGDIGHTIIENVKQATYKGEDSFRFLFFHGEKQKINGEDGGKNCSSTGTG